MTKRAVNRAGIAGLLLAASSTAAARSDSFSAIVEAAMARMHAAMMVPSSGNPDRDFAAMMIPHHQGAIDMAEAELRYGKDERLRRLAQGIIVEQGQEMLVMRGVLAELATARKFDHSKGNMN